MGRIYGGIEESDLQELIRLILREQWAKRKEDLKQVEQSVECFKDQVHQVQQECATVHDRLDVLAQRLDQKADQESLEAQMNRVQVLMQRKADASNVFDRLEVMEMVKSRGEALEKRLEASEQRTTAQICQKVDVAELEERLGAGGKLDRSADVSALGERIDALEMRLRQQKSTTTHTDSEQVGALRKALQSKVGAEELEQKLSALRQRVLQKTEARVGALEQQLQTKADLITMSERIESLDMQIPLDYMERFDGIERRMQQKAEYVAIDASFDELEQRIQAKDNLLHGRLQELDRRMQQKADLTVMHAQLAEVEEALAQKADAADMSELQQQVGQGLVGPVAFPDGRRKLEEALLKARPEGGPGVRTPGSTGLRTPPTPSRSSEGTAGSRKRSTSRPTSWSRNERDGKPTETAPEKVWQPHLRSREEDMGTGTPPGHRSAATRRSRSGSRERVCFSGDRTPPNYHDERPWTGPGSQLRSQSPFQPRMWRSKRAYGPWPS